MFREVRFQTGEAKEVIRELVNGKIPCVDIDDPEEFNLFVSLLEIEGLLLNKSIPLDKNARDRIKEIEFEFRAAFNFRDDSSVPQKIYYIDFYSEPFKEREYASVYGD